MLTAEVQAEYARRYGGSGDTAPIDVHEFDAPRGAFFMIYVDSVPAAMGGWRRHGESDAELKRMFVRPAFQRQGLAREMLTHLEITASDAGVTRLILETGLAQPEAVQLYRSSGYVDVEPFGYYMSSPLSVHLGKELGHRLTS